MNRTIIVAIVAAAAVAGPAFARDLTMSSNPNMNLAGFSGDANALPNAVTAIEVASGGHVVNIRYNNVQGVPGYDVVLLNGGTVSSQRFETSASGETVLTSMSQPVGSLKWPSRLTVRYIREAKVPLADAIRTAEARRGAPAVAAGLDPASITANVDVKAYNVVLRQYGRDRRVAIDAENGMVIRQPNMMNSFS